MRRGPPDRVQRGCSWEEIRKGVAAAKVQYRLWRHRAPLTGCRCRLCQRPRERRRSEVVLDQRKIHHDGVLEWPRTAPVIGIRCLEADAEEKAVLVQALQGLVPYGHGPDR